MKKVKFKIKIRDIDTGYERWESYEEETDEPEVIIADFHTA